MSESIKLKPVLEGEFWLIGARPDLPELASEAGMPDGAAMASQVHECVDHHIFQSVDGAWHLWGCIRLTPIGRLLYHWEAERLTQSRWRQTGEVIRADRSAGESLDEWRDEEFIHSPYVVQDAGVFHMFYGGHSSGLDATGRPVAGEDPRAAWQMCLMTSRDGRTWTRHRDRNGYSRVFVGPGTTRDPCLIRIDGLWHLYYAGSHGGDRDERGFYVRTSENLVDWSDWRLAHQDQSPRFTTMPYHTECPHVVFREGSYYLFRTEDYPTARTHVFRSDDPLDFGIGDAQGKYVCTIAVGAPEVIVDREGAEYITSNHDLRTGTKMCRLRWEEV